MQTKTSTLTAAIASYENRPVARVRVDWDGDGNYTGTYDDLTDLVADVQVNRAIDTFLPEAAQAVTGVVGAAEATIELHGTLNGKTAGEILSWYSGVLADQVGPTIVVELGFRTSAGLEYLPALTGRVRHADADADGGATLTALDLREGMTVPITLDVIVADDHGNNVNSSKRPGLNSQTLIDRILRLNGLYASPPARANRVLAVGMHGSAWPHVGTLSRAYLYDDGNDVILGPPLFHPHNDGLLGLGATDVSDAPASRPEAVYLPLAGVDVNNGSDIFVEWHHITHTHGSDILLILTDAWPIPTYGVMVDMATTGQITVTMWRGSNFSNANIGNIFTDGLDHYVAVHWHFTGTGATVNVKIDNNATLTTGLAVSGFSTTSPDLTYCNLAPHDPVKSLIGYLSDTVVSGIQITTEPFTAGMFNGAFVPTARLEPGLNELTGTPAVESADPFELITQIVQAELGVFVLTEAGVPTFYNRQHMSQAASSDTLDADDDLYQLATSVDLDSVTNSVTVPATPLKQSPVNGLIWEAADVIQIAAKGTVMVPAEFEGPCFAMDTSFSYFPVGTPSGTGYRASKNAAGTGGDVTNLQFTVTRFPSRAEISIRNPNAFRVFLVDNQDAATTADQGQPMLRITGQVLLPAAGTEQGAYRAVYKHDGSIARYREQSLEVDENPFRQSRQEALAQAQYIGELLAVPRPTVADLPVRPDPARQLADRVTVLEPYTLKIVGEAWVIGVRNGVSGSGMEQTLDLRLAPSIGNWDVARWDLATWGA